MLTALKITVTGQWLDMWHNIMTHYYVTHNMGCVGDVHIIWKLKRMKRNERDEEFLIMVWKTGKWGVWVNVPYRLCHCLTLLCTFWEGVNTKQTPAVGMMYCITSCILYIVYCICIVLYNESDSAILCCLEKATILDWWKTCQISLSNLL